MSKVPNRAAIWVAKDGRVEADSRDRKCPLFPKGQEFEFVLDTPRNAAICLRHPEAFSTLLDAFEASKARTTAGRLDDALKAISQKETGDE